MSVGRGLGMGWHAGEQVELAVAGVSGGMGQQGPGMGVNSLLLWSSFCPGLY